jgi:O-succinylbenzoic acid--CoA ligase
LVQTNYHKNFQLNGVSFTSVDELLLYTSNFSVEIHQFLINWFSDDESISVQTSGSTGVPKLILLKKEFIVNSAKATGLFFNLSLNTTALLCLPIKYIAGKLMLIRAITLGWKLDVIASSSNPLEKINKRYDFSAMVPLQLENSLDKLCFIEQLIVGGGVVSKELENKIQAVSTDIFATYGMTETITHIAVKKLNKINQTPNFYKVLPSVEIFKDDRDCLIIDAPRVSEELVITNDVVKLISDTQFEWLGRFDNVINSGGIKLQPEKIEEKLSNFIDKRFFVMGIPDKKLGQKLILIVEGYQYKINFKNFNISKFETPKEIYFIAEFIETETGKIKRLKTAEKISNTYK